MCEARANNFSTMHCMTEACIIDTLDWDLATHNCAKGIDMWFCMIILHCPFVDWTKATCAENEKHEGDRTDHDKQDPVTEFAQFIRQWKAIVDEPVASRIFSKAGLDMLS